MTVRNTVGVRAAAGGTPYIIPMYADVHRRGVWRKKGFRGIYDSNTTLHHRLYIQIYTKDPLWKKGVKIADPKKSEDKNLHNSTKVYADIFGYRRKRSYIYRVNEAIMPVNKK